LTGAFSDGKLLVRDLTIFRGSTREPPG